MTRFYRSTRRRRKTTAVAALLAFALLASQALAAEPSGAKGSEKAASPAPDAAAAAEAQMMEAMMKAATPGAEHAVLDPMAGRWNAAIKTWMGPGDPQVSSGTIERSWALGKRFMISKHTGDYAGMPFEGMEVLGYDNVRQQYVSTWIDNMGTGIAMSSGGSYDPAAKTLTIQMSFDDPISGKPVAFRGETKFVDADHQVYRMIGSMNGKEYTQMEMTCSRIK